MSAGPGASGGVVERVRAVCAAFPDVEERLNHGAPTFFFKGRKAFVNVWPDGHHQNTFPHLWCAAPDGVAAELIALEPERFFRPPYVGGRGWLGVRLDVDVDCDELAGICRDAYDVVAAPRSQAGG